MGESAALKNIFESNIRYGTIKCFSFHHAMTKENMIYYASIIVSNLQLKIFALVQEKTCKEKQNL